MRTLGIILLCWVWCTPALSFRLTCRSDLVNADGLKLEIALSDITTMSQSWRSIHRQLVQHKVVLPYQSRWLPSLHLPEELIHDLYDVWIRAKTNGISHANLQFLLQVTEIIEEGNGRELANLFLSSALTREGEYYSHFASSEKISLFDVLSPGMGGIWNYASLDYLNDRNHGGQIQLERATQRRHEVWLYNLKDQLDSKGTEEYPHGLITELLPQWYKQAGQKLEVEAIQAKNGWEFDLQVDQPFVSGYSPPTTLGKQVTIELIRPKRWNEEYVSLALRVDHLPNVDTLHLSLFAYVLDIGDERVVAAIPLRRETAKKIDRLARKFSALGQAFEQPASTE